MPKARESEERLRSCDGNDDEYADVCDGGCLLRGGGSDLRSVGGQEEEAVGIK